MSPHPTLRGRAAVPRRATFAALAAIPLAAAPAQTTITQLWTSESIAAPTLQRTVRDGDGNPYSITYDGRELRIDAFHAGNRTYEPIAAGTAVVRRNTAPEQPFADAGTPTSNPHQVTAWNAVATIHSATNHTVRGAYLDTMDALFTSQNLWTGTENLFVNTADPSSGNVINNVERMDYLFAGAFMAGSDSGFVILERGAPGVSGSNGGFKVAAITGMHNGLPTFAGSRVVTVQPNSYGDGSLAPAVRYDVFDRRVSSSTSLNEIYNVAIGPQGVSGVFIGTTELVDAGTPLHGYAVFGLDVTATGSQLDTWTNPAWFPTSSTMSNDADMIASGGFLFREQGAIPEPSTTALLVLAAATLARRRRP